MEETIRIRSDIQEDGYSSEKFINVNIEQKFDFLEILSLRISQEDVYRKFCSDYGVIVGRVQANGGYGVPNANVSVFIPIDDIDANNDLLYGLYPYQSLLDKNDDGVRYNLLPKKRQNGCHFPVGSFPNKREFLDNDVLLEIHDKYYKFTTTTNHAGDYMLFGVPVGAHTIHIDVDISDIGVATRRPYDMIREGNPENMFDTPTKYKNDRDLDQLRQIVKGEMGVDVLPFWGDNSMCAVGINRVDYSLPVFIQTSSMFIGSVITDSEKNSLNRHCRARKKAGEICEMRTGQGQIEMIRKTIGGSVEYKMVDGGRVIDDDGTWAYQIPMNLNPMVTDEFGNLVPSEDPRKGLMTQAVVRFRVGMDITGGEGRLRETAQYLVPHNPNDDTEVDYDFGDDTNDDSFYTMRFNKIYTVRNFIPRFQGSRIFNADNRHFLGIKDVDDCSDKENFPYNRLETNVNPIFTIIITMMAMVGGIVYMLNALLFPIINMIIWIINKILELIQKIVDFLKNVICWFIDTWNSFFPITIAGNDFIDWAFPPNDFCDDTDDDTWGINYIGCIEMKCDQSSGTGSDCEGNPTQQAWAPGCECCGCCGGMGATDHCNESVGNDGDCVLNSGDNNNSVFHSASDESVINADLKEYLSCVAAGLAADFNMFKFDFYNDWVNGTLYHFLYKNKRTADHSSFCNIDTDANWLETLFGSQSYLYDTLVEPDGPNLIETLNTEKSYTYIGLNNGAIKKYYEHMYYAPYISGEKLFATDITCLGSSLRCDKDGFPYFIDRIPSTTYNMPPLYDSTMVVCDPITNDEVVLTTESGIIGSGEKPGLFMNVSILGLRANYCQGRSIKLVSELGRNTDELIEIPNPITALSPNPNGVIGRLDGYTTYNNSYSSLINCDLNGPPPEMLTSVNPDSAESQDIFDEYARFSLRGCNYGTAVQNPIFDEPFASSMYDGSSSYTPHLVFRDFNGHTHGAGDGEFGYNLNRGLSKNNSYYFYFGLNPSKTAINKLNTRYLTDCSYQEESDFVLRGTITNIVIGGTNGGIEVEILGGRAPYSYLILYPDGTDHYVDVEPNNILSFTGLESGIYTLTVTDATGGSARGVYEVTEPSPVGAGITPFNPTAAETATGKLVINSLVNGVSGTYTITVDGPGGPYIHTITTLDLPYTFPDLVDGSYTVTVTDGITTAIYQYTLIDPLPFDVVVTSDDIQCHNQTGSIHFNVLGGEYPVIPGVTGSTVVSHVFNTGNLSGDTYLVGALDGMGNPPTNITIDGVNHNPYSGPYPIIITNPALLEFNPTSGENILVFKNGDMGHVGFTLIGGSGDSDVSFNGGTSTSHTTPYDYSENKVAGGYSFTAIDEHGCTTQYSTTVFEPLPLSINVNSMTEPLCHDSDDGMIKINVDGGIPVANSFYGPYKTGLGYKVTLTDSGGVETVETIPHGVSYQYVIFDDLLRGNYTATVQDYYYESGTSQPAGTPVTIDVTLDAPPLLILELGAQTTTTITVNANGGSPNYSYYKKVGTNWVINTLSPTNKFIGLISGQSYEFRVSDSHGCYKDNTFSTV